MLRLTIYTISKLSLTVGNKTNRSIFSAFMYQLFWISNSYFFVTNPHRHQNINNSSFHNISIRHICRCNIVAHTTSNEHKKLDYDCGSSLFNVLLMWRFLSLHKRKRHPFDSRNSTLLCHCICLPIGHFYWFLVSCTQIRNHNFLDFK